MRDPIKSLNHIQCNEKDFLENIFSLCPDGVIAVDRSGMITLFNPAAEVLAGHKAADVVGKVNIADMYPSLSIARNVKKCIYSDRYGGSGRLVDYEVEVKNSNGKKIPIHLSATLIYENGEEIGSVGFFHDLTSRKAMEEKLRLLSITDSLTGLYNQRHFHICLSKELERIRRYQRPLSLICFDLDHFKACNDLFGHLEGDNVLRLVGKLLIDVLRRSDMAFRYGGDEFFILLPETVLDSAKTTGIKIQQAFNNHWPYDMKHDGAEFEGITFSIGVAQAFEGENAESIIKRADFAMYEAKRKGGDCVMIAMETADRKD
jgi:diguanylate cyclase (GGDEF)-like protein/PAS domain S-box-containing protein